MMTPDPTSRPPLRSTLLLALLLGTLSGCSPDVFDHIELFGPPMPGATASTSVDITTPDAYVANLYKVGDNEVFSVMLTASSPLPKYTDVYDWTLQVFDGEGNPLTGLAMEAEPTMPEHGHGTFPLVTDAVEEPSGVYTLPQLDLFMAGVWEVEIRVTNTDEGADISRFYFDLE